jgi:hypothetical protein
VEPLLEPLFVDQGQEASPSNLLARCKGCGAYINKFAAFDRSGWICPLCRASNDYSDGANSRYMGSERRDALAELHHEVVDLNLDEGEDIDNVRVNPLLWVLVDVTGDAHGLHEVQSALTAALETLHPYHYFALSLVDERSLYIMNWESNRFHRIDCMNEEEVNSLAGRVPYEDVACSVTVKGFRNIAIDLVNKIEPKPAPEGSANDKSSCMLGEAVKGLLRYFAEVQELQPPTHANGRLVGSRLSIFLSKCPRDGIGKVLSVDERRNEDIATENFYLDPLNAEFPMQTITPVAQPSTSNAEVAIGIDSTAQQYYIGAGATAAVLAIAIDVFITEGDGFGVESLAPMTSLSGGRLGIYGPEENEISTLSEDFYKLLHRMECLDCSLRLRTSPETRIIGLLDSRMQEDSNGASNLFWAARLSQSDGFAVLMDHEHGHGMSGRAPVYIQMAMVFSVLIPACNGMFATVQKKLRLITQEFGLARGLAEVFGSHDADVHLFLEFQSAMTVRSLHGTCMATETLKESMEQLIQGINEWIEKGEYGDASGGEHAGKITPSASTLTEAADRLAQVMFGGNLFRQRRLDLLQCLHISSCTLEDLKAAIFPRLSAWESQNEVLAMEVPHSEPTIRNYERASILLLDTYDEMIVFSSNIDALRLGPDSKLMQYISSCRRLRIPTPTVSRRNFCVEELLQILNEH